MLVFISTSSPLLLNFVIITITWLEHWKRHSKYENGNFFFLLVTLCSRLVVIGKYSIKERNKQRYFVEKYLEKSWRELEIFPEFFLCKLGESKNQNSCPPFSFLFLIIFFCSEKKNHPKCFWRVSIWLIFSVISKQRKFKWG